MSMPITSVFNNWDTGYPEQELAVVFRYNFVRVTSLFAFMSAAAHFIVLQNWQRYETDLAKGMNRFRWFEYSLSSSLIICLLMNLWGHFEWVVILGVFISNGLMNLFGDLHEILNSGKAPKDVEWSAFWYGSFAGGVTWCCLWAGIARDPNKTEYPWYAWAYILMY